MELKIRIYSEESKIHKFDNGSPWGRKFGPKKICLCLIIGVTLFGWCSQTFMTWQSSFSALVNGNQRKDNPWTRTEWWRGHPRRPTAGTHGRTSSVTLPSPGESVCSRIGRSKEGKGKTPCDQLTEFERGSRLFRDDQKLRHVGRQTKNGAKQRNIQMSSETYWRSRKIKRGPWEVNIAKGEVTG